MSWLDQIAQFLSTPSDQLLAITAYGEAGQEGGEGMMAVLNVIKNRTNNLSKYGDSRVLDATRSLYHAVILKKAQFSMYNVGDPVRKIAERIAGNFDGEMNNNGSLQMAHELSTMLLNGQLEDNTGGADHYHADYVSPDWAGSMVLTTQIGRHIFYASSPGIMTAIVRPVQEAIESVGQTVAETVSSFIPSIEPKDVTKMMVIGVMMGGLIWGLNKKGVFV